MKINWFSPLPPAPTDIAHYTQRVLGALRERARVTLWTDRKEYEKRLEKLAPVRLFRGAEIDWTELNRADVSFYNIGNNPLFHGDIWRLSQRAPGVVILHDIRLHHFFDGLYRDQNHDRAGYLALMEKHYGAAGLPAAKECYDSNATNINEMAEQYPLTEAACAGALGVLTHTQEAFALLKKDAQQPLAYAPLPFAAPDAPPERAAGPPFRLIIFGYLGRNRGLAEIFAALGGMAEKERFKLDIYGEVTDRAEVENEINEHGLRGLTKLHGFAPEAKLDEALRRSHLAFNLRYPTMGEASGSQLRIWANALPALVTRTGWYAGLPENAVLFVRPEREIGDIRQHLRDLLVAPERFAALGRKGREILENEHTPAAYADSLLQMAERAVAWRGKTWAYGLAERAAVLSVPWRPAATLAQDKTVREIALVAGWKQPSDADYAPSAMIAPPPPRRAGWREKAQTQIDRWLLGAQTE
jgi:glycosyltransferase involved in cell wall biosynthesis